MRTRGRRRHIWSTSTTTSTWLYSMQQMQQDWWMSIWSTSQCLSQHSPCRWIICQRYSTSFCAKIRVDDSVCCWHFKSLSLISPLASLRRNKCSLHASFIFHVAILHVKIRTVIKYNFAHSEPPCRYGMVLGEELFVNFIMVLLDGDAAISNTNDGRCSCVQNK